MESPFEMGVDDDGIAAHVYPNRPRPAKRAAATDGITTEDTESALWPLG
jgi:hypothetical protein